MRDLEMVMMVYSSDYLHAYNEIFLTPLDQLIVKILIYDESFESIDVYLYSKKDATKLLKSTISYIVAILERTQYSAV